MVGHRGAPTLVLWLSTVPLPVFLALCSQWLLLYSLWKQKHYFHVGTHWEALEGCSLERMKLAHGGGQHTAPHVILIHRGEHLLEKGKGTQTPQLGQISA